MASNLLKSYLTDRSHCVKLNSTVSSFEKIQNGVPQGSVLGPLLFLIYINDLHCAINHSTTYHFADDTSLLCKGKSLKRVNRQVNEDLTLLSTWLRANKIALNASKTELIIFHSNGTNISKHLNFRLDGQKITPVKNVSYLGIKLDQHLNWLPHFQGLLPKLSRAVGLLAKLRHFTDYTTLLSIYYAFFDSHVGYSLQTWGHVPEYLWSKICILQNKALRIIHNQSMFTSAKPLYLQSKILPIKIDLKLRNCLFAFEILNKQSPVIFSDYLKLVTHNHQTRSNQTSIVINRSETIQYGSHNIHTIIAKHWNETIPKLNINPSDISRDTLRKHLKNLLLFEYASE